MEIPVLMGRLAAGLLHECNNPLSYSLSNLNTLRDYVTQLVWIIERRAWTQDAEEFVELLRSELSDTVDETVAGLQHIGAVMARLQQLALMDSCLPAAALDLNALLESLVPELFDGWSGELELALAEVPHVRCHESLAAGIKAVLLNAREAAGEGGRVTVVTAPLGDGSVALKVCDSGAGIPAEALHRVFEPFFTTKRGGRAQGLGLTLAYCIVHQHAGNLEIDSGAVGTQCTVTLPAAFRLPAACQVGGSDGDRLLPVPQE